MTRFLIHLLLGLGLATLVACESAEERAADHLQKGLALLDEGDAERALIEFRNVFKLDGKNKKARLTYARVQAERGNKRKAYGQYLRVVEQYPDNLEARRALAVQATRNHNWKEADRHGRKAAELAPEDPLVQSVIVRLDYRKARMQEDEKTRQEAVSRARGLLADHPKLDIARRVLIDEQVSKEHWQQALESIDTGLSNDAGDRNLLRLRLGVLEKLDRGDAIEAQLRRMVGKFPDDQDVHHMLLRWYVREGEIGKAEAYLHDRIGSSEEPTQARMELIGFLRQTRGPKAARSALDRIIAADVDDEALFRSVRAGLAFEAGDRQAAVAEMEDILETSEPSEQTRRIKVSLARMRTAMGNVVGARALVEEVLKADPTQVAALKLRARWRISNDRTGDAILDLRTALDQAPEDAEIMTLMARAHKRDGNHRLQGEMLSRAVEASGQAPDESLRYAEYLVADGSLRAAEDVLSAALRLSPQDVRLLKARGSVYMRLKNWSQVEATITKLDQLATQRSKAASDELRAQKLARQNRQKDLRAFLGKLQKEGSGGLQADAAIVRSHIAEDDIDAALDYTKRRLEENPDSQALRFLRGSVLAVAGRAGDAEAIFRDILSASPQSQQVWVALYRLKAAQGQTQEAGKVLEQGLSKLPDDFELLWLKASRLDREGEIDRAISIYESLYERNSGSVAVANNLASLISDHREGAESLQRAYRIARRLRNSDVAAFQDTYGWIAFRLGNYSEALEYLSGASAGLPRNATVQYHLARTYAALERDQQALAQYRQVADLARDETDLPFMDTVHAEIERLSASDTERSTANRAADDPAESN